MRGCGCVRVCVCVCHVWVSDPGSLPEARPYLVLQTRVLINGICRKNTKMFHIRLVGYAQAISPVNEGEGGGGGAT